MSVKIPWGRGSTKGGGVATDCAGATPAPSRWPHAPQKANDTGTSAPHPGHIRASWLIEGAGGAEGCACATGANGAVDASGTPAGVPASAAGSDPPNSAIAGVGVKDRGDGIPGVDFGLGGPETKPPGWALGGGGVNGVGAISPAPGVGTRATCGGGMPGSGAPCPAVGGGENGVGVTCPAPAWWLNATPAIGGGVGTADRGAGRPTGGVGAVNPEDLGALAEGAGTIDGSAIMVLAIAALPVPALAVRSPPQPRQNL